MTSAILSALVVALTLQSLHGQRFGVPHFPSGLLALGPFSRYANFGRSLSQQLQQQQQQEVLTCTSSNAQDPNSLIRLTITEQDPVDHRPMMMYGRHNDNERPRDWHINGYYKPSTLRPVSGTFQVVVTQYGRVSDGCNSPAMGPAVISNTPVIPNFLSPLLNWGRQRGRPAGHLNNPLYVTRGGLTVYSASVQGVSKSQLLGGGIAMCSQVGGNGECVGAILECCTIARDRQPASQVYHTPTRQNQGGNVLGSLNGFNGLGTRGGLLGSSLPFEIDSGDFLAFTNPNAALAASNDVKSRQQSFVKSDTSVDSASPTGLFGSVE